jgi:2-dehydropantoate 2-reductase
VHARVGEILFSVVADPGGRQFEASLSDESVPRPQRNLRLDDISDPPNDPSFSRYRSLRNTVAVLCSLGDTLHTSWTPMEQIQITLRQTLVVNSVINPVTAILGCRNGDVFTTTAARRLMHRICQEAADVFA